MRQRQTLTASDAQKIMEASRAEANKNGWAVSIAVVDDSGGLLQFERLDGVGAFTGEFAIGKAQISAMFKRPSKLMADALKDFPALIKLQTGRPMQGAVPVMYQGDCVGAVGVSGVKADEDEQIAAAGAAAIE